MVQLLEYTHDFAGTWRITYNEIRIPKIICRQSLIFERKHELPMIFLIYILKWLFIKMLKEIQDLGFLKLAIYALGSSLELLRANETVENAGSFH